MVNDLQTLMRENNIDWFIVFSNDEHLSEYTSEADRYLATLTGFTGSSGTLLVAQHEAYLWTDSRYFVQGAAQLKGTGITLMKSGTPGVQTIEDFLADHVWEGQIVAFDLKTVSYRQYLTLKKHLPASVEVRDASDVLKKSVSSMPKRSFSKIDALPSDCEGRSSKEKIEKLREKIRKEYVTEDSYTYILSDLCSIMWLFNIRGSDITYVPVAYSYAMIDQFSAKLYVSRKDLSDEAKTKLEKTGVILKEYSQFYNDLREISTDVVLADPYANNSRIMTICDGIGSLVESSDPVLVPKAYKNATEIKGMKESHLMDAVTMIRFIKKVKEMAKEGNLPNEYEMGKMLDNMRLSGGAEALSFKTICAYKENCAIVHYIAHEKTAKDIKPEGFLLVDSGGQYRFKGTTDITRTISLGPVSDEEKKVYTTVLKGNLRLMNMVFPQGYTGAILDMAAEEPLWNEGYFCGHGIGHGVGCYLSVHESEARISRREGDREIDMLPGVVVSDEPGVYLEGKFGVRLENLLLVERADPIDGYAMCRFRPLTLVPFDRESVDVSLLSDIEKEVLRKYNEMIVEEVGPLLDEAERSWLKEIIDIK